MRPLSEKVPGDKPHETAYAVRQLQRRPAPPSGAFEWAYFRGRWTDAIANLTGTSRDVNWGPRTFGAGPFTPGWEIYGNTASAGEDVFRPRDTGGSTTVTDAERVKTIDVLRSGIVTVTWGLRFDLTGDAVNGDVYSFFTKINDSVDDFTMQQTFAAPSGVQSTGWITTSFQRTMPVIDPFSSGSQTITIQALVSWSGPTTGEDVTDGFIDISWVGITTETGTI